MAQPFKQSLFTFTETLERIDTPNGRHYAFGICKYPSITTVLGSRDTPWLDEWRARVGEDTANFISRRSSSIGTGLHSLSERYLRNEDLTSDLRSMMPATVSRFKNFKSFLDGITEVFILEGQVHSHILGVAGTVDCFAMYEGIPTVIDFKNSRRKKLADDIKDYFAQASFYAYAIAEMFGVPVPRIAIAIAVEGVKEPQVYISKPSIHASYLLESIKLYRAKNEEKKES